MKGVLVTLANNLRVYMLKFRLLTALILLPLMILAILFLPALYFGWLLAIITALGAWEWSSLIRFEQPILRAIFVIVVCLGMWLSFYVHVFPLMIIGLVYWLWVSMAVFRYNHGQSPLGLEVASVRVISGILFLVVGFTAMLTIRDMFG